MSPLALAHQQGTEHSACSACAPAILSHLRCSAPLPPAVIFAYQGQSMFLEIMREMRSPRHFPRAVFTANGAPAAL